MVNQTIKFKSLAKFFSILLITTIPCHIKALNKNLYIDKVNISLDQDFSIIPSENTKASLCNEDFMTNIYAQLALTQLQIFKDPSNFANIDAYRNKLIIMYQHFLQITEQLAQYINLEINPKPLVSPTYFDYLEKDHKGNIKYREYPSQSILSEPFMKRLQKDKELYLFIKRTEVITKNTRLLDTSIVQKQKQIFLHYFPYQKWVGTQYVPVLYGLETSEEILDQQSEFSVARYRFWNIRMYRSITSDDDHQADLLINYLEKITNDQIDAEIRIYACDLYASMLFEFQCLLQLNNATLDEQIQKNFSLFRIIEEKFFTNENIGSIPVCSVAVSPQDYFMRYIVGLNLSYDYPQEDYVAIGQLLNSGFTDDFTSDNFQLARYFFDFDIFIINIFINNTSFHHLSMQEMKSIQQFIFPFQKNTNVKREHIDMITSITISFLRYLLIIQSNEQLNQKITPEGILESMKFQYLVFTYIRLKLIETNNTQMFESWDTFIQYYTLIFNRQLQTGDDDELIRFVGEERYYSIILITIEIITYTIYPNNQNYPSQIYETMGDTIKHGLLLYFKDGQMSEILQQMIIRYTLITDEDFITPRIIQRVYLEDRVEDMLLFLNEKRQNKLDSNFQLDEQEIDNFEQLSSKGKKMTNFDHLTEKRSFYKTLVQVIYSQQQSENNNDFKNKIKEMISQYKKSDKEYQKIITKIDQSNIDFIERQQQVYQHIYLYAIYEIQLIVDREPATTAFLSFMELYNKEEDAKFSRSENTDIPEDELRTINFLFMDQAYTETVDYDDKWNELLFMDSMFLYPFLYVKHRENYFDSNQNNCQNYDPSIMTTEEAEFYQIQGNDLEQIKSQQQTHCIEQRQQAFHNLLLDEEIMEGTGMTQYDFVKHLIFSPEMYLQIEQFEFMVDAFQIFNIYEKINGQRLMTDNVLNDLFFSIYRFIIQIRSDPQFVYDFDFWGTISMYIERCMNYQRFGNKNDTKYYYCAYGYERYNQMYWFIKDAQYKFTGDFEIMKLALQVDRSQNSQSINWGDRTHGRFDYFTHYLVKVKTFNNYSNENKDMIRFNEDNNWKNEFWDECSLYAQQQGNIDYCKFLYKVGQFIDQFDTENENLDNKYEAVVNILKDNLFDDNDKIIAWEVLDFFQFEEDFDQGDTIEKIRTIIDSELINQIKQGLKPNQNQHSLSYILNINNMELLGQYGMSKYNQNTTIKNLAEIQYGLQDSKKNFALHNLLNDSILNTEQNIFDFLSLQQSETHTTKFKGYKLVHHIPLSLLLYYADEEVEFTRIASVLKKTNNLEMMFLSSVKAGEMIIEHFGTYIKKKFKNQTKDTEKYTMKNLETFITGIEKQVAKNRTIKDLTGLKTQKNGQQLNLSFSSNIANTKMSLTKTIQTENVQIITKKAKVQPIQLQIIEKEVDPNVRVISDSINDKEIKQLPIEEKITIQRQSVQNDLEDSVLSLRNENKNQKSSFQMTQNNLTQDLESQKNEIKDMQNQEARIATIKVEKIEQKQPNNQPEIKANLNVSHQQVTKVTVIRKKKETLGSTAKTSLFFTNENIRLI